MAITQSPLTGSPQTSDQLERARRIDSGAWAVFFIWLGFMLAGLPWAWFLIGVGVLILGAQLVRRQFSVEIEMFGVVIGLVILAAGVWELFAPPWPLMSIILIAMGGYLLWKTFSPRTGAP